MSTKRQLLKVIILGDSGVGKTSLMHQYVNNKYDGQYKATIGADFLTKDVEVNGQHVTLQIWDTAGQERFQSLGSAFYRGADACILVFDVTNQPSFAHIGSWLEEFNIQAGKRDSVLLGNKSDMHDLRQVNSKAVQSWCAQHNVGDGRDGAGEMRYFETSAKKNIGVEEAFMYVVTLALAKKSVIEEEVVMPQTVNLNQRQPARPKETSACSC